VWFASTSSPPPVPNFTSGLKSDGTTFSRKPEWPPRFAFAALPFQADGTVIRGGIGVFYDILPMTAGTFTRSQQRVVQVFAETDEGSDPGEDEERTLINVTTSPHLTTAHITEWTVEVDQE